MPTFSQIQNLYWEAVDKWFDGGKAWNRLLVRYVREYNTYVAYKRRNGFRGWRYIKLDRRLFDRFWHDVWRQGQSWGVLLR